MPPERKTITFEDTAEVPFLSESSKESNVDRSNYSTISSGEGANFLSHHSTVSSTTSYPMDTVVLLHKEQRKFEANIERQNRGRSLKGTICFIFTILILLGLIGLAIASLHHKLSADNDGKHRNTTLSTTTAKTFTTTVRPDLPLNYTVWSTSDDHIHQENSTTNL